MDVAHYNLETREWLISGGSRLLKEMYQQKIGAVLHGSSQALTPSNRYTLEPLRQGPELLLESGVEEVRSAVLKEVTLQLPTGVVMSLKKADVFAELMRQREHFQDSIDFVEARFAILLRNRRRLLQVIVSPVRNTVSVSSGKNIVDAWLEDRGFITHANTKILAGN